MNIEKNRFSPFAFIFYASCSLLVFFFTSCSDSNQKNTSDSHPVTDTFYYKNHSDTVTYVGMQTCRTCHMEIYKSFIQTGMGKSFDRATKEKSSGDFKTSVIRDTKREFIYSAYWKGDELHIGEYRISGLDTNFKREEKVDFIIGSGQHTNSHLQWVNGYINQMPMTFYAQSKKWDLPPGFEDGHNSRFSRKIGLECMSCHNAYPDFILGSENKFRSVPNGIDCERCHGPGSVHVAEKSKGILVDTSKQIDYSIVNPAKLPVDLQFDICQRCHLQGNAVLNEGKSFFDFKPGIKLKDVMSVFLPKYKGADEEFIMASHADRLKMSACFIESAKNTVKTDKLKPYKDALTCVTCHNPHVSVRETNKEIFNDACKKCHANSAQSIAVHASKLICTEPAVASANKKGIAGKISDCVSCHMPKSGSIDIPHVTVHDHYIRKPISAKEKEKIKEFIGLYAINNSAPSKLTKAKAYINQYEKFEWKKYYLDSARLLLSDQTVELVKENIEALVQLYFIQNNFGKIISYAEQAGENFLLKKRLTKKSFGNENAWTCYRIGESYYELGRPDKALAYLMKSNELAPFVPDFMEKLASVYSDLKNFAKAGEWYTNVLKEDPRHVTALSNFGFLHLQLGKVNEAENLYKKGLALDPDHEGLLMNMAGLMNYRRQYKEAKKWLELVLKKYPENKRARQILEQLKNAV